MNEQRNFLTDVVVAQVKEFVVETNDEILSLVKITMIVHEHAFDQLGNKEKVLQAVKVAFLLAPEIKKSENKDKKRNNNYDFIDFEFASLEVKELISISEILNDILQHILIYAISEEKMTEWINKSFDSGAHQCKVYNMEIGGNVMNTLGIALNFSTRLVLHDKGFLTTPVKLRFGSNPALT